MLIDLMRHGEPVGGSLYRGHSIDDPLSEKGWSQMWDAIGDEAPWGHIITSPLQRCSEFATTLAARHHLIHSTYDDLREIGFGAWEGKTKEQLKAERADEFAAFYRNPVDNTPENAEPVRDFFARVSTLFDQLIEAQQTDHVLIVTHAGVIRAIVTHALQAPLDCMYRLTISNGGISRLRKTSQNYLLEQLNGKL